MELVAGFHKARYSNDGYGLSTSYRHNLTGRAGYTILCQSNVPFGRNCNADCSCSTRVTDCHISYKTFPYYRQISNAYSDMALLDSLQT